MAKKSKKGRLSLEYHNGHYQTIEEGHGDVSQVFHAWPIVISLLH